MEKMEMRIPVKSEQFLQVKYSRFGRKGISQTIQLVSIHRFMGIGQLAIFCVVRPQGTHIYEQEA